MSAQQLQERIDALSLQMAYIPYNSPRLMAVIEEMDALELQLEQLNGNGAANANQPSYSVDAFTFPVKGNNSARNAKSVFPSYAQSPTTNVSPSYRTAASQTPAYTARPVQSSPTVPSRVKKGYYIPSPATPTAPASNTNLPSYVSSPTTPAVPSMPTYASYDCLKTSTISNTPTRPPSAPSSLFSPNEQQGSAPEPPRSIQTPPKTFNQFQSPNSRANSSSTFSTASTQQKVPQRPSNTATSLLSSMPMQQIPQRTPNPRASLPSVAPVQSQAPQRPSAPRALPVTPPVQAIPQRPSNVPSLSAFADVKPTTTHLPSYLSNIQNSQTEGLYLAREARLSQREREVVNKEQNLQEREQKLLEREKALEARESTIKEQERVLRAQKRHQIELLTEQTKKRKALPNLETYRVDEIIHCQKLVRRFLHKKGLHQGKAKPYTLAETVISLKQSQEKAVQKTVQKNRFYWVAMHEILLTEERYVNDLAVVVKHYLLPIFQSGEQLIKVAMAQEIFGNFSAIYDVSVEFLGQLQQGFSQIETGDSGIHVAIANLLSKLFTYTSYYVNFDVSNDTRQKLQAIPKVRLFLEKLQEASPTPNYNLDTYLIKPCQRLPRYKLLMEAVIKNTPPSHRLRPEYERLAGLIDATIQEINEKKRESENQQVVASLAAKLVCPPKFELFNGKRRFVFRSPLCIVIDPTTAVKYSWKTRRFGYLFSDVFIAAKNRMLVSTQTVLFIMDLRETFVLENKEDTEDLWNYFIIKQGKITLYAFTETVESKDLWVSHIMDTQKKLQEA